MRVAYVINSVEGGGAATPVPAVCDVLRRHGAEVRVLALTGRDRRGLAAMEQAGLDVSVRDGGEADHRAALGWLRDAVADAGAEVVWTSLTRATLLGQIAAGWLGLPVVSWQHAAFLKPANRVLLRLRQRRTALWLADSECVAALTKARLGVPDSRLMTWPLFAVDPGAPQGTPWQPDEPLRIGSLGRLHRVKGFDVLVEAIALLQTPALKPRASFEVLIAGEGHERAALEEAIARHRLTNVRLVGFDAKPRDFLATLHLYVQPSRSEGLCIAAHEAMQAGLPTICSAVGEMPYTILDRQTGRVVPPGDPEALAFALADCLVAPEKLRSIGDASRARVTAKLGRAAFESRGAEVVSRVAALLPGGAGERHRTTIPGPTGRSASRRSA